MGLQPPFCGHEVITNEAHTAMTEQMIEKGGASCCGVSVPALDYISSGFLLCEEKVHSCFLKVLVLGFILVAPKCNSN